MDQPCIGPFSIWMSTDHLIQVYKTSKQSPQKPVFQSLTVTSTLSHKTPVSHPWNIGCKLNTIGVMYPYTLTIFCLNLICVTVTYSPLACIYPKSLTLWPCPLISILKKKPPSPLVVFAAKVSTLVSHYDLDKFPLYDTLPMYYVVSIPLECPTELVSPPPKPYPSLTTALHALDCLLFSPLLHLWS